jgi:hypothetical protein
MARGRRAQRMAQQPAGARCGNQVGAGGVSARIWGTRGSGDLGNGEGQRAAAPVDLRRSRAARCAKSKLDRAGGAGGNPTNNVRRPLYVGHR